MRRPPDNDRGRPPGKETGPRNTTTATNGPVIVTRPDDRQAARRRLAVQRRQRDVARLLEQLAPLAGPDGYYCRRTLTGAGAR
jgi:hypothetical protein